MPSTALTSPSSVSKCTRRSSTSSSGAISGSSCEPRRPWAAAGGAWQGRRIGAMLVAWPDPRTPPGGDQRSIQGCRDLPEGPLWSVARLLIALVVALELSVGPRERVLAALSGLAHEVQVAGAGRVGGGLDRGQPGVADRRGRQAAAQARVVRRVGLELALPDGARPVSRLVADRRVDPGRHAVAEPVVDHRGDQGALARELRLALHQRGDDQHVVAGEVLPLGVREVDGAEVLLERVELLVYQAAHRAALAQRVGGREQEALGGVGAARSAQAADAPQHAPGTRRLRVAALERPLVDHRGGLADRRALP